MRSTLCGVLILLGFVFGCRSHDVKFEPKGPIQPVSQEIEYPDVDCVNLSEVNIGETAAPPSARRPRDGQKRPLALAEAIQIALLNSQVIRNAGGQIVSAPQAARTVFDPAIQEADPRNGVEAALSAFDAQLTGQLVADQTDRLFNNIFFGGGVPGVVTTTGDFQLALRKTAATGTQFSVSNLTNYNRNASPVNLFPSVYDTLFIGEFRHPLMQGGGLEFNRIAGPNATAGNYNGVLLARINSDVSLADFETAVRDLIRDVETAYWELYFSYRDLDAKRQGQQLSLESWRLENNRVNVGSSRPDQEAFARQQYYQAQAAVENALSGTVNNAGGVYAVERRLRILLGLPTSDGTTIVPSSEPITIDTVFDWQDSLMSALTQRVELRRQQWQIKRRELELVASRNFQRMRVDVLGQYRYRGFGDNLFGETTSVQGSAFDSLVTGDLQEWRLGVEVSTPVGNRIGHAAVRHAELQYTRERAVYDEMERQVSHQLNSAFTELDRAYMVTRSNYNRRTATLIRLQSERQRNANGLARLDLVLDAQRQAVDSESNYYRALVDYNVALMNMHFTRGTLLEHHQIQLAEGPWSPEAHQSAAKLSRRFRLKKTNYRMMRPPAISRGTQAEIVPVSEENPAAAVGLEPPVELDAPQVELDTPGVGPPLAAQG